MRTHVLSFLVVVVSAVAVDQAAKAVEIVYEGFGYPTGYLTISDAATPAEVLAGTLDSGTYDDLDDGTSAAGFDHDDDPLTPLVQPTVLGDPARAGGSGSWIKGWSKRNVTGGEVNQIDGTSTLSYTDSLGNELVTTMGRPIFTVRNTQAWRPFDASTVDPNLTFANTGSTFDPSEDYGVPTLGKQGSVVWFSFLGDHQLVGSTTLITTLQLWNKRSKLSQTNTPKDRTGGITAADGQDWHFFDTAKAEPVNGTGVDITGSLAADDAGDVFIVAKIDYSAINTVDVGGPFTDGWADVSFFVNPDLDAEPTVPVATTSAFIPFNAIDLFQGGPSATTPPSSSIDEIRLGTTYADVAPIAASGLDGDFDSDDDVDGGDFLLWQRGGSPNGATSADLALWEADFGSTNPLSAVAAVPEPASVALMAIAGVLCLVRRRN